MKNPDKDFESISPILFCDISKQYLLAAQIIWNSEFSGKNPFFWNKPMILRPLSQLLGVAIEASLKGLISSRGDKPPKTHCISKLFQDLADTKLEAAINLKLRGMVLPEEVAINNPNLDNEELKKLYRQLKTHIELLDLVYSRPFVSRYPILGVHSMPDVPALIIIAEEFQNRLDIEKSNWVPNQT
ncbi:hypothetical protein ROA7450_02355 [Roseovarius albus]|uniref:HEPN domain-containing protein n=1 Tax=Roseovarius albus TaxID=1247867 RepID=A0A1X6ZDA9_9RHOB|nr:HEPN domain-containing protein [Roseovarius albus]SLN47538.1 hypothetical protein ROA7450_02355 [Roseovarius albus]